MWWVPSFYGDIQLRPAAEGNQTILSWEKVTASELKALTDLRKQALKKGWVESFPEIVPQGSVKDLILGCPMAKAAKLVTKALKPGRETVSAIRVSGGRIEEIGESTFAPNLADEVPMPDAALAPAPPVAPAAATTVAKPTQGCPEPDFVKAEIRSRAVLEAFLNDDQISDFRKRNRFVSIGAETGHRYMVTSRHARDELAHYRRQVFDLDEERPFCIHDYSVPAAEELLAIHLLLSMPQHENYVRHLE